MKLTVNKSDIIEVLAKIQGLTGRKSNLAITENLLIRSGTDGIILIATDLESGFEGFYPAQIQEEGTVAINAKTFYEIVRELPTEEVRVHEVENRWIEIGNRKVLYHIVGMNPEDFPDHPQIGDVAFVDFPGEGFKKMIEKTVMIAGAPNDKRAHINGVLLENRSKEDPAVLRLVSTDGSRLTLVDHELKSVPSGFADAGLIVPKRGLSEVGKFLEGEENVRIGTKDNKFIVKKENETFIIRLLEGDFPKYEDIITRGKGHEIRLERLVFLKMLKRMSILSSETYKGVIFHFRENNLEITATNPDRGESKEDMDIEYGGEPMQIAFNPRYFIDVLNAIEEDTVVLHIIDEEKPCLIDGEADKRFLSVIMPMRI